MGVKVNMKHFFGMDYGFEMWLKYCLLKFKKKCVDRFLGVKGFAKF